MRPGATFTDAFEELILEGDEPAILRSVELLGGEGLRIVGFQIVGPGREVNLQSIRGFPPVDPDLDPSLVEPGEGATLTPGPPGSELLLGLEVTRNDYIVRDGIRITYSVGDIEYTAEQPAQIAVCTSPSMEVRGDCPFPEDR